MPDRRAIMLAVPSFLKLVSKTMNEPHHLPSALSKLRIERRQERAPHGRTLHWGSGLILLVVAAAGLFFLLRWQLAADSKLWFRLPEMMQQRTEVRLATVSVEAGQAADATVVASGYLESRRQAKIGSRAPGRIDVVNVEEGSRVSENEIIAVLEHADLDASLAATEASLAGSRAQLAEQAVVIDRTQKDLERARRLLEARSISDEDYDNARFDYQAAQARAESLAATIRLAEARVREAEQMKENMFIRAPFDGTVISKDAEVGESILPGGMGEASGRGSVATIADLQHLEVDCDVKEDFIGRVAAGQAAEVAVDAVPDRRYQGRVRKVIPMGDRARATIKVKVELLDADARLFPNMSSTVYFLPEGKESAPANAQRRLFCDTGALRAEGDQRFVWVLNGEDRLQRVNVRIGNARDQRTEIVDGLSGSERVVIAPDDAQADQLVKISQ